MCRPDLAVMRQQALHRHVRGELQAAESLYAAILEHTPEDPDILHLFGVAALQREDAPLAIERIGRAIERSETATYLANFGAALRRAGRLADAIKALRRAVTLDPARPEAQCNLGNALCSASRFDEALAAADDALKLRPNMAEAWLTRAMALGGMPHRGAETEAAARVALAARSAWPEAHLVLANALLAQNRLDEAASAFRQAIALRPAYYAALVNLGVTLGRLGQLEEAACTLAQAVALQPDHPEAALNLGGTLRALGRLPEARQTQTEILQRDPSYWPAWSNLAAILHDEGCAAEALAAWRRSLALNPDQPDARYSSALTMLLGGDFANGWNALEARWQATQHRGRARHTGLPLWGGEDLAGRTILLHAEEGIGDTIQFARYVPLVAACGGRVVVETYGPLARLFASLPGVTSLMVTGETPPPADLQCPLQSLPRAFGTRLDTIPASVPYLQPDELSRQAWARRLAGAGLRVGLVWAGSPTHGRDRDRSIPFDRLAPLWTVPGVRWHSLQVGPRAADLVSAPGVIEDLSAGLTDFAETAAAICALDLVIAVDTSVAHLAGALGRQVWLLLPAAPDWRWLLERTDSPWYPTMRLFRRQRTGDWPSVLERVAAALTNLSEAGGTGEDRYRGWSGTGRVGSTSGTGVGAG